MSQGLKDISAAIWAVPSEPSNARREWQVDRWVKRGAACLVCGKWPAPVERLVLGKLVVVCRECDQQPSTAARIVETIAMDWEATREAVSL
jgi:hypothetical protein